MAARQLTFALLLFQTFFQSSYNALQKLRWSLPSLNKIRGWGQLGESIGGQGGGSGQEHERVKQERGKSWTLLRIVSKKTSKEGGSWRRNSWRQREGAGRNAGISRCHRLRFKRRSATEESEDHAAKRPNLRGGTVTFFPQNFWCDVVWSAAH